MITKSLSPRAKQLKVQIGESKSGKNKARAVLWERHWSVIHLDTGLIQILNIRRGANTCLMNNIEDSLVVLLLGVWISVPVE